MEYSLTEKGRALAPLIEDMRTYGREWLGVGAGRLPPRRAHGDVGRRRRLAPPRQEPPRGRRIRPACATVPSTTRCASSRSSRRPSSATRSATGRSSSSTWSTAGTGPARRCIAISRARPRSWTRAGRGCGSCPAVQKASAELGAGAAPWLRVNGMRGEQAEPALRAMLGPALRGRHQLRLPRGALRAALRGGGDHALPRRRRRARGRAAGRRDHRERSRGPRRRALARAWATARTLPPEAAWPGDDSRPRPRCCASSSARCRLTTRFPWRRPRSASAAS